MSFINKIKSLANRGPVPIVLSALEEPDPTVPQLWLTDVGVRSWAYILYPDGSYEWRSSLEDGEWYLIRTPAHRNQFDYFICNIDDKE